MAAPSCDFFSGLLDRYAENPSPWNDFREQIILEPYSYLANLPGKDFRTTLLAAFNHSLQIPEDKLEIIARVVAKLHTASLLIDDVQDKAVLRRASPSVHTIFGVAQTINAGNYVYFTVLEDLRRLDSPAMLPIYTEELMNLHRGQGMDVYWRDTLVCPTEEEYVDMVNNKTSGLLRFAIKLMQDQSQVSIDFVPLVNLIGIIFQIRDDYMNLESVDYTSNKGYCEDLTEGKFSFPIIHAIRANRQNRQILNILKQHTTEVELKKHAVKYIKEETLSFEYTKKVLEILDGMARREVERLGNNGLLIKVLDWLRIA